MAVNLALSVNFFSTRVPIRSRKDRNGLVNWIYGFGYLVAAVKI